MSEYLQNTDANFFDHPLSADFYLRDEPEEEEEEEEEGEEQEDEDDEEEDDEDEDGDEGYSE
jgi:hypothetical protein